MYNGNNRTLFQTKKKTWVSQRSNPSWLRLHLGGSLGDNGGGIGTCMASSRIWYPR
jgi:hypothetical protein